MIVLGLVLLFAADSAAVDSLAARAGTAASVAGADTVMTLPEVRVDRDRPGERNGVSTGFATELRPRAAGRALETLAELLFDAPGVRIQQYGGLGAFSTVSLRGAPAGQVAVTLDGTPIQSASQGAVNLSDLTAASIERIDVHRGVAPIEQAALPGGSVDLVSRSELDGAEASAARGAFGTWESSAGGGLAHGPLRLVLHGGYLGSAGDFTFADDNGTPFNAADDSVSTRVNNRLDSAAGLASLTWLAPFALRATLRHHQFHRAQGVPGIGVDPALHPRLAFDRALTQLEASRAQRGFAPQVMLRGAIQRDRSRFRDTAAELRPQRSDRDDRFRSGTVGVESRWTGVRGLVGIAGSLSRREERAEPFDALQPATQAGASTRETGGASLALTLEPWNGALLLRAARRWERTEDEIHRAPSFGVPAVTPVAREIQVPQLGARLRLPLGVELRGNWTDAQRPPDFTELFGDQGSVQGNPALLPERGENWDAGGRIDYATAGAWRSALEFAHFQSRAENLIVYVRNSPSTVRASNVSRAEIRGDELSLQIEAPLGLRLVASGTTMRAVDRGSIRAWAGKRLPGRSDRQAAARLDWQHAGWRAGVSLDYLGDNYLDPANRRPVPDRTLIGARLAIPFRSTFRLIVEGKNLGDRRPLDVGGYPLPGRSVFASLDARFGAALP